MRRILVTGGAGFIGSALVRFLVRGRGHEVVNLDALTYAGNPANVAAVENDSRYRFVRADIGDPAAVRRAFEEFSPDAVVHLAAESHVDRSIDTPARFLQTNVTGTFNLLQAAKEQWERMGTPERERFRFHHVSTDEVYGALGAGGSFSETSPYRPNSPYAATKAASDHLARAWHRTYGLPVVVTNCSNNYGPYQYPEKLVPLMLFRALAGRDLPVYGDGGHVRDWLFVDDHVRGLYAVLTAGRPGEMYNIGGHGECANLDLVRMLCGLLDELRPRADARSYTGQIAFVPDRPGHDRRYAIDSTKIRRELGWKPEESLETGLRKTVEWYLANDEWVRNALGSRYGGERLGRYGEALGSGGSAPDRANGRPGGGPP